jgi:hypothetical protein
MNKPRLPYRPLLVAASAALLFFRCSFVPLSGGGTEGGNVSGLFVNGDGTSSAMVRVLLVPADYNAGAVNQNKPIPSTFTATDGSYSFARVPKGSYSVEAFNPASGKRSLITGITVSDKDVRVPIDSLRNPGTIKIFLQGTANTATGYFFVPGTTIYSAIDGANGFITITSVPAATLPPLCYSEHGLSSYDVIRYGVEVQSGDTVIVANPDWKYARRLFLNTTAGGANVSGDVYDFPVLVRLTAGNFTFAQAKADGGDLRFTKNDGTPLPYEIERYDAGSSRAEIWVKTDTVYGNDCSHFITMYWGNPDAADSSNGAAAFDAANGFAGVWHLGENGDSIYDATGNAFNGKKYGSTAAPGIIGNSELFANSNHIRIPGLLNRPSNVTLSAWVRSDTSAGRGQDIVSIGDAALIRFDDVSGVGTAGFYHNNPVVNDSMYGRASSGRYLAQTGWHYLAFSINSDSHVQTFYIDGVECANTQDVNPIYYAGLGTDTYIGIHGNGKTAFNFIGQIDEVRVNNNSVAPDWVKLCFMNQKAQDALIIW